MGEIKENKKIDTGNDPDGDLLILRLLCAIGILGGTMYLLSQPEITMFFYNLPLLLK